MNKIEAVDGQFKVIFTRRLTRPHFFQLRLIYLYGLISYTASFPIRPHFLYGLITYTASLSRPHFFQFSLIYLYGQQ